MGRTQHTPTLTEVLIEPGQPQLWVTLGGGCTHLLDLTPLLASPRGETLRLSGNRQAVSLSPDGTGLRWPGLTLPWVALEPLSLHQLPAVERYRPLLPYLRAHEPWLGSTAPLTSARLQQLLSLRPQQLVQAAQSLGVSDVLAQQRLYDIGTLLAEYVGYGAMLNFLRRPWPPARRLGSPLFHSAQDCLLGGRPDLVERCLMHLVLESVR